MFAGNPRVTESDIERLREELGLNDPVPVQYFRYMKDVVQGDLGWSMKFQKQVSEMIKERMWSTFYIAFLSVIVSLIICTTLYFITIIYIIALGPISNYISYFILFKVFSKHLF